MKNARDINAITVHANAIKETKRNNIAIAYTEKDLMAKIEENACQGKTILMIKKPSRVKWKYVRSYLEQNDFKVFTIFGFCWIKW